MPQPLIPLTARIRIRMGTWKDQFSNRLLKPLGYELVKRRDTPTLEIEELVTWATAELPEVICAQVGANDGMLQDPMKQFRRKPHWRTWLLEPQPEVWQRLVRNTADEPASTCLNKALAPQPGTLPFYTVDPGLKHRAGGIRHDYSVHASTDRTKLKDEVAMLLGQEQIDDALVRLNEVEAITWSDLLDREIGAMPHVVLLDTEGMDFDLLQDFPFARCHPEILIFEHIWIRKNDYTTLRQKFDREGYVLIPISCDTVAVSKELLERKHQIIGYQPKAENSDAARERPVER